MKETLALKRRLRWNRVQPALLRSLQERLMFWRRAPAPTWDWATLASLAIVLWILSLSLLKFSSLFFVIPLWPIGKDLHDNALPIFARVRIRGDKLILGRVFTERHSLREVEYYSVARKDLAQHAVEFSLSERYWPDRFSFIADEEDCARVITYLQARGIGEGVSSERQLALNKT